MSTPFPRALVALLFGLVIAITSQASAAPIGAAAPVDGFYGNSGAERFDSSGEVFAIELMDSPGGEFGEFGIYYDAGERITLFGADDLGSGQAAMVDLIGGSVVDLDANTIDYFDPRRGDFGFYFEKHGQYVYSENHLNEDLGIPMSIGTYESTTSPEHYLITLEWYDADTDQTYAMELVGGVRPTQGPAPSSAVPEPGAAMLFGLGALVMHRAIRRNG